MFRIKILALSLLCLLLWQESTDVFAQDGSVVDEIAAVVGNQILLRSEIDGIVAGVVRQQGIPFSEELWASALQQMVDEKVLIIHARRDTTLIVTDDQVNQMLDQQIGAMSAQVGGQSLLEEAYGKTIVELKAELADEYRDRLLADALRGRKSRDIKVTPSDVTRFFAQFPTDSLPTLPPAVRVSHIVRYPAVTDEARAEAREIIDTIRDSVVVEGASFEDWASLFSEDPGSAQNGGRYESMSLGEVVPEFAAVASRAAIGEVSQVFETQFGLHVLRVNTRRGEVIDYNHILIKFDETKSDSQVAIDYLTAVRDSVSSGQIEFPAAARRHSEDQLSANQGGRVIDPQTGDRELFIEALGPFWQQTLSGLAVDSVSLPREVELLDGRRAYHIVHLRKRTPEHQVTIASDYSFLEQYALRQKRAEVMAEWLLKLRDEVYIDIRADLPEEPTASN